MLKRLRLHNLVLSGLILLQIISCKVELVPSPSSGSEKTKNPADYTGIIQPPQNLKASNGKVRSIELTWDSVDGAVQYQIYSAPDAFHTFDHIGDTEGSETSYLIEDEPFGTTKAYIVRAVSYYEKVSYDSNISIGSTLSIPFITGIETDTNGTTMIINWWLENCNEQTYGETVKYKVSVFDENHNPISGIDSIETSETTAQIYGLASSTKYLFQVAASTDDFETFELSDFTSRETAHKVIPQKVNELTIEQGCSKTAVKLEWKLPQMVYAFDSVTLSYDLHPVYFTVQRKPLDAEDSEYKLIAGYIGANDIPQNLSSEYEAYSFDCETNSAVAKDNLPTSLLTVEKSTSEIAVTGYNEYHKYTSDSKITYYDTTAKRGIQYVYKIQSYTDFVSKTVTSEEAVAQENGWLLSVANFKAEDKYETQDENSNIIQNIKVSFTLDFDTFDKDYKYLITQTKSPLSDITATGPETVLYSADKPEAISNYSYDFTSPVDEKGYYFYKLYILNKNQPEDTIPLEYLDLLVNSGVVTVTEDATSIPKIENLVIKDGYKDYFEISWDKLSDECIYQLEWTDYADDGSILDTHSSLSFTYDSFEPAEEGEISVAENRIILKHFAISGDRRKYTLKATNGLSVTKTDETIYETLGTPNPVKHPSDYSKITIEWPSVQKADKYILSAYYDFDENQTELILMEGNPEALPPNTTLTEKDGIITCEINEPAGFDDPEISGKIINLSIQAVNNTTNNLTQAELSVKNLGPAETGTQVYGNPTTDRLRITWNSIEDATGYIIYRTKYKHETSDTSWDFDKADSYFFNAITNEITQNGESDTTRTSITVINNKYLFTDISQPVSDETNGYQVNQAQIALGLTYGYVIIPVKEKADDFVFDTDLNYLRVTQDSKVVYSKPLTETLTGTFGYGLNVNAAKSENSKTVEINWQRPFENEGAIPFIYRRQKDSDTWTCIGSTLSNATSYYDPLTNQNKTKAYYYAVEYSKDESRLNYIKVYEDQQKQKDLRYNDGIDTEELNKGYLFYTEINAKYNGTLNQDGTYLNDSNYYSQSFTHTAWDFEERMRGPSQYQVYAINYNTTLPRVKLADFEIDEKGAETCILAAENGVLNDGSNDTSIEQNGSALFIKPIGISNGTLTETSGITKVLRSTKTIYNFESQRDYTRDGETKTATMELEAYGYRQITGNEFAKCIGLIIADAIYKAGIPAADGLVTTADETTSECMGGNGSLKLIHTAWRKYLQWGFTGKYTHQFSQGCSSIYSSQYSSEFTLDSGLCEKNIVGSDGNKLYHLPALEIPVSHESGLESMNGTVTFSAGTAGSETIIPLINTWAGSSTELAWNLSIKKDNLILVSITDDKEYLLKYFPYDLGTEHATGDKSCNTSFETYKNNWWN